MVKHTHPKTCWGDFHLYLSYTLEFFQIPLTGDRSYQYLQDATLFGLLPDKSTVYFNSQKSIGIEFSILAALANTELADTSLYANEASDITAYVMRAITT